MDVSIYIGMNVSIYMGIVMNIIFSTFSGAGEGGGTGAEMTKAARLGVNATRVARVAKAAVITTEITTSGAKVDSEGAGVTVIMAKNTTKGAKAAVITTKDTARVTRVGAKAMTKGAKTAEVITTAATITTKTAMKAAKGTELRATMCEGNNDDCGDRDDNNDGDDEGCGDNDDDCGGYDDGDKGNDGNNIRDPQFVSTGIILE